MEQNGLEFGDLRAFFVVAETGSFTRAAHRLESAKSIVSRRVARLEEALSARLLQRTPTGTILTEAGQVYYEQAHAAMMQLDYAAEALNTSLQEISGAVRITVPIYFGATFLAPVFCDFMAQYPKVELEIATSDDKADLVRDGYDIAVRVGQLSDSTLIGRPLCHSRKTLVASPDYLASAPALEKPEDLAEHRILHYNSLFPQELWRYHVDEELFQLRLTPYLRSNSATILMAAVCAGQGLTVLPSYCTQTAIAEGRVVEVLPDINWGNSPITILTPQGRKATRRVRVLIDFLIAKFSSRVI